MARNKLLYYSMYPADFDRDERVRLMTLEEIGAYVVLLNHAWTEGSIPADMGDLARILRLSKEDMQRVWAHVGPCFVPGDQEGRLVNPRQEEEREEATRRVECSRESGRLGGLAKAKGRSRVASDPLERTPRDRLAIRTEQKKEETLPYPSHEFLEPSDGDSVESVESREFLEPSDGDSVESVESREFLEAYPRKTHRDAAARAYPSMIGNGDHSALMAGLQRYMESGDWAESLEDGTFRFIPHPDKFLTERMWLDHPAPATVKGTQYPEYKPPE